MTTMVRSKKTHYVSGHCAIGNHEQCNADACRCSECTHSTYVPREVSSSERSKLDRIKADLDAVRRNASAEPVVSKPVTRQAKPVSAPKPAAPHTATETPTEPTRPVQTYSAPATGNAEPSAVRAWAVANGWIELAGQRGRLPLDAIAAYRMAHGNVQSEPRTPKPAALDSLFALPPATEIRAWAVANGWESLAGQRGRLPLEAIQAFISSTRKA